MKKILRNLITGLAMTLLFAAESTAAQLWGIDIHGFISQGYLMNTENDLTGNVAQELEGDYDDFAFGEVGINFGKELTDDLRVGIQLFARDYGKSGNNDLKLDWVFADYRFQDWLGMRVGQLKQPHGLYNETRDIGMLRNPIFLPESVYHDLSQDLFVQDVYLSIQGAVSRDLYLSLQGVGIYGFIDLAFAGGLSYQAMYGIQQVDPNKAISSQAFIFISEMFGEDEEATATGDIETKDIAVDYKYAGNLIWETPLEGLRLGFSMDNIRMSTAAYFTEEFTISISDSIKIPIVNAGETGTAEYKKLQNWVGSIEYTWNNLLLVAEVIKTYKKYDLQLPLSQELSSIAPLIPALAELDGNFEKESSPWGWYAGGALRLTDWLELGGYYSETRNDADMGISLSDVLPQIDYFSKFKDFCATIRFDINEFWALKLEAHHLIGEYSKLNPDNPLEGATEEEESWNLYAAKMTVAF